MKECKYHGRSFCAPKASTLCGIPLDTCSLLSELYDSLDNAYVCPTPAALAAVAAMPVVWVNGTATTAPSMTNIPVVIVNATSSSG